MNYRDLKEDALTFLLTSQVAFSLGINEVGHKAKIALHWASIVNFFLSEL